MGIPGEHNDENAEGLDELQTYLCKLYPNLFIRIGKIRNAEVRADFYDALKPVQQKGSRVPIILQEKMDREINRLIKKEQLSICKNVRIRIPCPL